MNRVTSIGEVLFDVYPGSKALGGAPFNFIYHIIKLTGTGNFVSRVGNDSAGNEILDFLKKKHISTEFIQIDNQHTTGESIATLNEQKIPSWKIKTPSAYDFIDLNDDIITLVNNKTDCLYFGTLAQREKITRRTIHYFYNQDIKYFCDLNIRQNFYTKDLIQECLAASSVIKINIEELHLINELLFNKSLDKNDASKRLLNEYQLELLCVTYGDDGAIIYKGENHNHYKLKAGNVVDTVGAGDAYAAILCIGYLQNWDIERTNKIASEFAGEIIKINGALPDELSLYEKYKLIINEK
jgi:fructokinase